MARRGTVVLMLVGLACSRPPPTVTNAPAPAVPPDPERARFEELRANGGFTKDAYVVWSPVWPTATDEVTVLYDTRAPLARFHTGVSITWYLTPEDGQGSSRLLAVRPDGIAAMTQPESVLKPGRFAFGQGDERDNDCGNPWKLPIVPETPRWQESTSTHFRYRWLPGDPVAERIHEVLDALESHLSLIAGTLGLAMPTEPVVFLHYASRDLGFAYQAHHGNNADEFRHLVFSAEAPDDAHELTHLLVNEQLGRHHEGLFDEGLATHLGQELAQHLGWQGRSCDSWAREGILRGDLPRLSTIVAASRFYSPPWTAKGGILFYGAACSFVADVVARYGASRLRDLLHDITCDNQDDTTALASRFEAVFGVSIDAADAAWRSKLVGVADAGAHGG